MYGQADGSIIIDTELDSQGFEAGSKELESAISSFGKTISKIGQSLNSLGPTFTRALQGSGSAINSFDSKIGKIDESLQKARNEIINMENQLRSLGNAQVPTEEYTQLSTRLTELDTKLYDLLAKQRALDDSGVGKLVEEYNGITQEISRCEAKITEVKGLQEQLRASGVPTWSSQYQEAQQIINSLNLKISELKGNLQTLESGTTGNKIAQYQSLSSQIEQVGSAAEQTQAKIAAMEQDGSAYTVGAKTAKYQELEATLRNLKSEYERNAAAAGSMKSQLAGTNAQVSGTERSTRRLSNTTNTLRRNLSRVGSVGKAAFSAIGSRVRSAASSMLGLLTHTKSTKSQFSGLISSAKKFTLSLLGARGVYALLRKAVSAYMSENEELSNTLDSVWSGIGNLLGPIITRLINLVATATSYVTSFLKLFNWFGTSTSKALSGATSSAKELKNALASFDDLNILSHKTSSSGSDSDADSSTASLPKITLPDWAKEIAARINAGDWAGAAKILANKLNGLVDSFDWAGYGAKIGKYINGALSFLATFITSFDWTNLGTKLATFLNNLIKNVDWSNLGVLLVAQWIILLELLVGFFGELDGKIISEALHELLLGAINAADWVGLSGQLARNISKFITDIDWEQLGEDISLGFRTILQSAVSFVENFDWKGVGEAFGNFVNGIDFGGILSDIIKGLAGVINGISSFIIGFVDKVDWAQLAKDLANAIKNAIKSIKWEDIGKAISGILTAIIEFAFTLLSEIDVGALFQDIIDAYGKIIENLDLVEILKGLGVLLASIVTQIPGIFLGLFGGIADVIGSFFKALGLDSVAGFFKGIGDSLRNAGAWLKENLVDPIVNWVKNLFGIHSPSTVFAEIGGFLIQGLLNGIKAVWGSITGFFSDAWDGITSFFGDTWENIKNGASKAWEGITTTLSGAWEGIKTTASTVWEGLKTTVSGAWQNIKTNASTAWENVKTTLSRKWENIKTEATRKFDNIKTGVSGAWQNVKTAASTSWENIKSTLSGKWENIKTKAGRKFENIKSTIQDQGWAGIGSNICNGISDGLNSAWNWLSRTAGNIATNLYNTFSSFFNIHSPSKLMHDKIGLNIGFGIGEGIEDSESAVLKSVTGIADAIASEAKAGIPSIPFAGNAVVSGLDRVASSLTDIASTFQSITDMLSSMGGLKMPQFAAGTVIPYANRAEAVLSSTGASGAIPDELSEFMKDTDEQFYALADILKEILADIKAQNLNIDVRALSDMITRQQRDRARSFGM